MEMNPILHILEKFGRGSNHVLQQRKTKNNPPGLEFGKQVINSVMAGSKAQLSAYSLLN